MKIEFESKEIDFNEDVIISWYVTSPINNYRITLNFIGGITEDGKEYLEGSSMAYINITETKYKKRDILDNVYRLVENSMEASIEEETIMINAPDYRYSLEVQNEDSYDGTLEDFYELLGAFSYVLLQEETMMDINRKED